MPDVNLPDNCLDETSSVPISTLQKKKRGRKPGQEACCSACGKVGHYKGNSVCQGRTQAPGDIDLNNEISKYIELHGVSNVYRVLKDNFIPKKYTIYGIKVRDPRLPDKPPWFGYIGQTSSFVDRSISHERRRGKIAVLEQYGLVVESNEQLETETYESKEEGKNWMNEREAFHILKHKCHPILNPELTANDNVPPNFAKSLKQFELDLDNYLNLSNKYGASNHDIISDLRSVIARGVEIKSLSGNPDERNTIEPVNKLFVDIPTIDL